MLGDLLERIKETLNEQEQGGRDGSVNIIVGNSGTVIIGSINSPPPNDVADTQKKTALEIAPKVQREVQRLRHQVQTLKRLVNRVYTRNAPRAFKRTGRVAQRCRVSIGVIAKRCRSVANHTLLAPPRQTRPTPACSLVPARINPSQPTLTRLFQSFCPLTRAESSSIN